MVPTYFYENYTISFIKLNNLLTNALLFSEQFYDQLGYSCLIEPFVSVLDIIACNCGNSTEWTNASARSLSLHEMENSDYPSTHDSRDTPYEEWNVTSNAEIVDVNFCAGKTFQVLTQS